MARIVPCIIALALTAATATVAAPAAADHTDPREPLAPTEGFAEQGIPRGEGTWEHLANFRGLSSPALTGGGTDLEFFSPAGTRDVWGSFGTLGQDEAGSVGQRLIRLTENGEVKPTWVADHGSAHCPPDNQGVTALQHDVQIGKLGKISLMTDTTDAVGRCHDPAGGGIEIVDVSSVTDAEPTPREVHLVRFAGFTHTNTIDHRFDWIVYNSSSDFADRNWIDVMNMKSCFGKADWSLKKRRSACRPEVTRIQLKPKWTQQRDSETGELEPGSATCHDITFIKGRLYCAALNATVILDVKDLVRPNGSVRGQSFPCTVEQGTLTGAKVTDCSAMGAERTERAKGWRFVGKVTHPGRDCGPPGSDVRNCNTNFNVPSDQGVAVAHEADPSHDQKFMFVTDERGGGIVPPGATCEPGLENPVGNGGAHAFDISDPSNIEYATTPSGEKAVYISETVVPAETFCDIHVMERVKGEQRFVVAYYTQGVKIVDYFVDDEGHLQFEEVASFTLPNANTWAAEGFKVQRNEDGTKTYFIAANDIHRGIDVLSWTGEPNPIGSPAPARSETLSNSGLAGASFAVIAAALLYRRRHRSS
jgi:hypothetical protein